MRFGSASASSFFVLTLVLGLAAGCPSKEGGGTEGTGTESSISDPTVTDGAGGDVCECIAPDKFGAESYQCATGPCAPVHASCDPQGGGGGGGATTGFGGEGSSAGDVDTDGDTDGDCVFVVDEEKLACVLDLLISGEPGRVEWGFTEDGGFSASGAFVQIRPMRHGLTRSWHYLDLGGAESAAGIVQLEDADYFQRCKDKADPRARFDCMRNWSIQKPADQCDGEGMAPSEF